MKPGAKADICNQSEKIIECTFSQIFAEKEFVVVNSLEKTMPKQSSNQLTRFLPITVVVAGLVLFFAMGWHQYLSFEALSRHRSDLVLFAADNAFLAVLVYVGLYIVVTAFSLPGGVWLTLAGGFVFGGWLAGIYTVVGATIGATCIFLAARYAFADLFREKAGENLKRMEAGFQKNAFNYLMFLRLVPAFPFWLVNLVPALLDVKLSTYVTATFLGIIPGTFVFAFVGAGLGSVFESGAEPDLGLIFEPQVLLPILALACLSVVPVLHRKFKSQDKD